MRRIINRKTGMKVVNGRTRHNNRHVPTVHRGYVIDRRPAGRNGCHVLTKRDLQTFIELIPDWTLLSHRLERIVLGSKDKTSDGWHQFHRREETGAIWLNAWDKDLRVEWSAGHYTDHNLLMQRLGVRVDYDYDKYVVVCWFNRAQARAFMLLHVFMHELGHHWDRLLQKQQTSPRGEDYAESFANRHLDDLFPKYVKAFGHPETSTLCRA